MTPDNTLARLEAVIAERRGADPASSYVAKLNARGLPVIARKLGEGRVDGAEARINEMVEKAVFNALLDLVTRSLLQRQNSKTQGSHVHIYDNPIYGKSI